jgi:adenine phosphoribosyltransferase
VSPLSVRSPASAADLRRAIRDIPDFPKAGITFKDITPLLSDCHLLRSATHHLGDPFIGDRITHVVAVESRGFILGSIVALALEAAFVPVRKPGKLPYRTERVEYALEYGTDALEIHTDSCGAGDRVLIVDDVLATGGTANAACALIERLGAEVIGCSFLIGLSFLAGVEALSPRRVHVVVTY